MGAPVQVQLSGAKLHEGCESEHAKKRGDYGNTSEFPSRLKSWLAIDMDTFKIFI